MMSDEKQCYILEISTSCMTMSGRELPDHLTNRIGTGFTGLPSWLAQDFKAP